MDAGGREGAAANQQRGTAAVSFPFDSRARVAGEIAWRSTPPCGGTAVSRRRRPRSRRAGAQCTPRATEAAAAASPTLPALC
eukprot:scaffold21953_cov90-Isochrysis_galbana.AAC.2